MSRVFAMIKGLGLGAGLMYIFDPVLGHRRRALLGDQIEHTLHELDDFLGKASRDLRNRMRGVVSALGSTFDDEVPDDRLLTERVRAKLGRVVAHPHAIAVTADRGRVTLRGPILAREVEPLRRAVASVRGVTAVDNQLEVHESASGVSALQGGVPRTGQRSELLQENWSPATRLIVGAAGGFLALRIAGRGGLTGLAVAAVGLGLIASGLDAYPQHQASGARRSRRGPASGRQQSMTSAQL